MKKVFLGGTCNDSKWRDKLISMLNIDYFNPVVDDWTEECYQEELKQREICDYCLYVITPRMTGVYSIAEAIDDSNKRPNKTLFCVLKSDIDYIPDIRWNEESNKFFIGHDETEKQFDEGQMKSLDKVGQMVKMNGGKYFKSLEEVASYLNKVGIEKIRGVEGIPNWIKRGHEILPKDKWEYWDEIVPIRAKDLYEGMELDCTLDIEEILQTKTEDSFKRASNQLDSQGHSGMSYGLMKAMIREFCTNGKEFVKYLEG